MDRSCLTCHHAALRDKHDAERDAALRRMASLGFLNCTASAQRASFHPVNNVCKHWVRAAEEIVDARREWAAKKEKKQEGEA
jgi:hypothetical protein